jgi:transcriptional regulator GlxA family with amidase domain
MASLPSDGPDLRVGFLLAPDFTLLAFSGFIDTLRLAADEGDRSRQRRCAWTVMGAGRQPVRASNGVVVAPDSELIDPAAFDYVVVVGGLLRGGPREPASLVDYLRRAADLGVPLIGLCNGSFILARAGLMKGRRTCVSWFHHQEFVAEFPDHPVDADRLFLIDGERITGAGGTSVIHLASHLVDLHCGAGHAAKGLRIMIEEEHRTGAAPQPAPLIGLNSAALDPRVRRAMLLMERRLAEPLSIAAIAGRVGTTPRHLGRLFRAETGVGPAGFLSRLRLDRARDQIEQTRRPFAAIAADCGFTDAAHLSRSVRATWAMTPTALRAGPSARSTPRTAPTD